MHILCDINGPSSITEIIALMSLGSRLPCFLARNSTHVDHSKDHKTCATTVCTPVSNAYLSQNIYNECNVNLMPAQKGLKLDHDHLGHIGFQRLQALYQCQKDIPHFDGTIEKSFPILVAQDKWQINCLPPICATCQVALMCHCAVDSKQTCPNPEKTDMICDGNLKPGNIMSIDQYESSVLGRLPLT